MDTYLKYTKKRREEQLKELEETFRSFKDSKYVAWLCTERGTAEPW